MPLDMGKPAPYFAPNQQLFEALKDETKLRSAIAKACGGDDQSCATPADGDDAPATIAWPGTCPDFEGKGSDPAGKSGKAEIALKPRQIATVRFS